MSDMPSPIAPGIGATHVADHPPRQAVAVFVEHDVGVERPIDLQRLAGFLARGRVRRGEAFRAAPSFWLIITAGMRMLFARAPGPIGMIAVWPDCSR